MTGMFVLSFVSLQDCTSSGKRLNQLPSPASLPFLSSLKCSAGDFGAEYLVKLRPYSTKGRTIPLLA